MKVILLEKIHNFGNLGDTVNVKAGFGRNYLIPYGKAVAATPDNLAKFEGRRSELEKIARDKLSASEKRAENFKDVKLLIKAQSQEEGRLFGSVGVREIVEALSAQGLAVERKEVILHSGTIHEVGEFDVILMFHGDVAVNIKVVIEAE